MKKLLILLFFLPLVLGAQNICISERTLDTQEQDQLFSQWRQTSKARSFKQENFLIRTQLILQPDNKYPNVANIDKQRVEENLNRFFKQTGIQFKILSVVTEPYAGQNYTQNSIENLKKKTSESTQEWYKIWVVGQIEDGGIAGYNYFPQSRRHSGWGMVITPEWVHDLHVSAHEAAHGFGIRHTFSGGCGSGNCATSGDRICDTPPDATAGSSCSGNDNTCTNDAQLFGSPFTSDVNDDFDNIMDYGGFTCKDKFTPGQIEVMQAVARTTNRDMVLDSVPEPEDEPDEEEPEPEVKPEVTYKYIRGGIRWRSVTVYWETSKEVAIETFQVQRSVDRKTWRTMASVEAHGPNKRYAAQMPRFSGRQYYRLRVNESPSLEEALVIEDNPTPWVLYGGITLLALGLWFLAKKTR